jgi:hypothetical protein
VLGGGVARVALEVLVRAPVLEHGRAAVEHALGGAEEPGVRVVAELAQHLRHRQHDRQPPVRLPRPVDAHPDREHDEVAFDRAGVASWEDRHGQE